MSIDASQLGQAATSAATTGATVGAATANPYIGAAAGGADFFGKIFSFNSSAKASKNFQEDVVHNTQKYANELENILSTAGLTDDLKQKVRDYYNSTVTPQLAQNPYIFDMGAPEPRYPKGNVDFKAFINKSIAEIKPVATQSTFDITQSAGIYGTVKQQLDDVINSLNSVVPKDSQTNNINPLFLLGGGAILLFLLLKR